jgi:translation machinery-associated protein 16
MILVLPVDIYGFFHHAIPPDVSELSLESIHELVRDTWLTRHDEELAAEKSLRRKGRPKTAKESKLEEIKLRESELYRTGMGASRWTSITSLIYNFVTEVPDLTYPPNVDLFRQWDLTELAYIQLLRFIRISSAEPHVAVVSRPGKHLTLLTNATPMMEVDKMEITK